MLELRLEETLTIITGLKIIDKNFNVNSFLNEIIRINKQYRGEIVIQAVDADRIASWRQLAIGVIRCERAFRAGRNIASEKYIELILRISGRRQIIEGLNLVGLRKDTKNIALIIYCRKCEGKLLIGILNSLINEYNLDMDDNLLKVYENKIPILKEIYNLMSEKPDDIEKEVLTVITIIETLR